MKRYLRLEWVTPDGPEQAWFVELCEGPFPVISPSAEILDVEAHPEIEPAATVRMDVTSWNAPIPPPILWGGELRGLMG